ncbi:hypothetical protein AB0M95_03220 [Sphaerisporangium sp. NPDC051017]|uniref:hypothetical protein n=1 Tax=Sphaerisporangium sp. NPDC051017 TaxID=3154636 RepID=UPI00344478AF
MSDEKLSQPELARMVALMREAREVSNSELEKLYGLTLVNPEREHLNKLGLVDSWKQGRGYAHVLTDAGWARMRDEIAHGFQSLQLKASPKVILEGLAGGLHSVMERNGYKLLDIFGPSAVSMNEAPTPIAAESVSSHPVPATTIKASESSDLEALIRAAYKVLAKEPGAWVGLAEIRSRLGDVPRAQLDQVLRLMNRSSDVNLVPESNNKSLSKEDREAAVNIGDQDKHLLSIGA